MQDLYPDERHAALTLSVVQQYVAVEVDLMAQELATMEDYFESSETQTIKGMCLRTFM